MTQSGYEYLIPLDEVMDTKKDVADWIHNELRCAKLGLKHVADRIKNASQVFLTEVLRSARDKRYPGIVNQKIRLVIGGGGAALKTYQVAAIRAFTLEHPIGPTAPEVAILRKPDTFHMSPLPSEEFHRFAVAYGLSFPINDLPEHVLCKDVEMISRPKQRDRSFNPLYD